MMDINTLGGYVQVTDKATGRLALRGAQRDLIGHKGIIVDRPAHLSPYQLGEDAYYRYVSINGIVHRVTAYALEAV